MLCREDVWVVVCLIVHARAVSMCEEQCCTTTSAQRSLHQATQANAETRTLYNQLEDGRVLSFPPLQSPLQTPDKLHNNPPPNQHRNRQPNLLNSSNDPAIEMKAVSVVDSAGVCSSQLNRFHLLVGLAHCEAPEVGHRMSNTCMYSTTGEVCARAYLVEGMRHTELFSRGGQSLAEVRVEVARAAGETVLRSGSGFG